MSVCGYLYTPSHAPLPEQELAWLKLRGADPILHDWGSRTYLEELFRRITAGWVQEVLLLRLADLGDRADEIHERLLQLQHSGIRLSLVTESGLQARAGGGGWRPTRG
ncbi:hypothetical protein [Synechococcus sp. R55.2]|uniref:hypothetical protein n=1 Tax=Synechococcus sp. R55.2 TaxID=2964496 RepID=UPI0039C3C5A6